MKKISSFYFLFIFLFSFLTLLFTIPPLNPGEAVGEPCNLVQLNSCPSGLACKPKDNTPNSPLTCQPNGAGDLCDLVNPNSCPSGLTCKPRDATPNSPLTCQTTAPLPAAPAPPCANPGENPCTSFNTGLGDISTNARGFIGKIFGVLLAASGGIALLLIIRAGYKIMTSLGNPETVKEGRDQLIAAIVGLLFLIFSFVLLELIGVDILKIPGLAP